MSPNENEWWEIQNRERESVLQTVCNGIVEFALERHSGDNHLGQPGLGILLFMEDKDISRTMADG